ncbi:12683_t:CDS:2, partial [Cetraspora pellucida]
MEDYYDYSSDENLEENFSTDQDELLFVHDYLAAMKARHWLEEQDSLEILEDDEDNEDSLSEDKNMDCKFLNVEENNLSPCIIIDNLKGEIRRCNSTYNLKSLSQLFGTWKIEMTPEENSNTNTLGVCSSHFNFDHSKLHSSHAKQFRNISQSWLSNLSYSENENQKEKVVWHMMKLLENPNSDASSSTDTTSTNTTNCLPSPLLVKTAMRINAFDYYLSTDKKYVKADEYRQHSEALGNFIRNSPIQNERERMLMLYSEFELVDELTCAFDLTNPKQYNLFKHAQEMNQDEEVYKTKKVTKGRKVKNIVSVLAKEYQSL